MTEGELGDKFYVLNVGKVEVLSGQNVVAVLEGGNVFGEMTLLGVSNVRSATIRALEFCDCRVITNRSFQRALQLFSDEKAFFDGLAMQRRTDLHRKMSEAGDSPPGRRRRSSTTAAAPVPAISSEPPTSPRVATPTSPRVMAARPRADMTHRASPRTLRLSPTLERRGEGPARRAREAAVPRPRRGVPLRAFAASWRLLTSGSWRLPVAGDSDGLGTPAGGCEEDGFRSLWPQAGTPRGQRRTATAPSHGPSSPRCVPRYLDSLRRNSAPPGIPRPGLLKEPPPGPLWAWEREDPEVASEDDVALPGEVPRRSELEGAPGAMRQQGSQACARAKDGGRG